MTFVEEKLTAGGVLLLDGAVGTELQRRGVPMDDDAWCGRANLSHPDAVRAMHRDYIAAGADIITSNTFGTNRYTLEPAGLADRFEEINRSAVRLAQEARDDAGGDIAIAGSMSTMPALAHVDETPSAEAAADDYRRLADTLAEGGCDVILCEMMMTPGHAEACVDAARATGLPVWVGFSVHEKAGRMITFPNERSMEGPSSTPLRDADRERQPFIPFAERVMADGGAAAGIMHSEVEDTAAGLDALKTVWSGPLLAYAHSGTFTPPDWTFRDIIEPEPYAEAAACWVAEQGVQIVGGCCGLTPDHIRALKERLN